MVIQKVKVRRKFMWVCEMHGLSFCSSVKETFGICSVKDWWLNVRDVS